MVVCPWAEGPQMAWPEPARLEARVAQERHDALGSSQEPALSVERIVHLDEDRPAARVPHRLSKPPENVFLETLRVDLEYVRSGTAVAHERHPRREVHGLGRGALRVFEQVVPGRVRVGGHLQLAMLRAERNLHAA